MRQIAARTLWQAAGRSRSTRKGGQLAGVYRTRGSSRENRKYHRVAGGHLVSGHVDGIGEVVRVEQAGESCILAIRAPHSLSRYVARKGAITVNGVSLTVNRVEKNEFEVNLIPHTLAITNLRGLQAGAHVNLEVDMVARYLERLVAIPMSQNFTWLSVPFRKSSPKSKRAEW